VHDAFDRAKGLDSMHELLKRDQIADVDALNEDFEASASQRLDLGSIGFGGLARTARQNQP